MNPVYNEKIKRTSAPPFKDISSRFTAAVNDGSFAAVISGYLVPPLTGKYKLLIEGHMQAMLSFSIEKKSIVSGIEKQTEFNGDTATYVFNPVRHHLSCAFHDVYSIC